MSDAKNIDYQRLEEVLTPVEIVLNGDFEGLRRKDERERTELWNKIKQSHSTFEGDFFLGLSSDLRQELANRFTLSQLLLATVAYANQEESPIMDIFNIKELELVKDFEKFNVFDILSTEEIVQRAARREDIYDLIVDFYKGQYSDLDLLLDDPEIQRDLKVAFKNRYQKRLDKIVESVKAYVGLYGPVFVVTQIEKRIWDTIKESEDRRKKIAEELEGRIGELNSRLEGLDDVNEEHALFAEQLSDIEASLIKGGELEGLTPLESQKDEILAKYLNLEKEMIGQVEVINQRRRELDEKEAEMEAARDEYHSDMEEEKERLVQSELNEIAVLRERLMGQEEALGDERTQLQLKREEIDSRLMAITDVLQGKPIRFITKDHARLCELNFIARFESKMETLPIELYSPIESKSYRINSWKEGAHQKFSSSDIPDSPGNIRSRYAVFGRKFGFFGGRVDKVVVEAVSLTHLDEFDKYGFDSRRANLADFLSTVNDYINTAEMGKYLHVLGIASPTGWDDRVKKEIESVDFAHNYVSRHVSICLVDSVTGEVVHNPTDDRISTFVEFYQPQFDNERMARVTQHIRDKLDVHDYVLLEDVAADTSEPQLLVHKVFYELENEGKYRVRYIDSVGLVLEVKR